MEREVKVDDNIVETGMSFVQVTSAFFAREIVDVENALRRSLIVLPGGKTARIECTTVFIPNSARIEFSGIEAGTVKMISDGGVERLLVATGGSEFVNIKEMSFFEEPELGSAKLNSGRIVGAKRIVDCLGIEDDSRLELGKYDKLHLVNGKKR